MITQARAFAFVKVEAIAAKNPEERVMISPREVARLILAEPFQPFRIHTASGRTFDVRHPEFVQVGRSVMTIYAAPEGNLDGPERWERLSYMLIESIAQIDVPVSSNGE
jgi:hypothetical protein